MKKTTGLLISIFIVCLIFTQSANADWINFSGAENAPNIAEIHINDDHVKVVLEIFVDDLVTFHHLVPDDFFEGKDITGEFIRSVLDITNELPPQSWSILTSLPSMFEEVAFRGVLLTFFLVKYSKSKSIVFSSLAFGIIHIFNIFSGRDPVWVSGQVIWAFILGVFYGYLFIKTGSLLPVMFFHYLGNVFVGSLSGYIQETASVAIQALYGVIFTFGLIPVILMILWIRFFSARWPFEGESEITTMVTISTITV